MYRHMVLAANLLISICYSQSVHASETVKYIYDAKGRLIKVERTGTVNNNVNTVYEHDKADNRKKVKTTGSSNTPPS